MSVDSALLDRARALAPVIEADADAAERDTTTTTKVVEALKGSELLWSLVPRELGGLETDILTALAVFEEIARADGSTGWSAMANITSSCFAAIYTGDSAAKSMFAEGVRGIHAGMLGPVGTAKRVDGGYLVNGKYQFGSGCAHATHIGAGTIEVGDDGTPLDAESGLPAMRVVLIPSDQVEFRGNWDVLGLTSTGSYDYVVADVFVPEDFTFSLLEWQQQRGGDNFGLGLFAITAAGHAGFALGVGRRVLDEIIELARTRTRMAAFEPISAQQLFQYELGMHDSAMRAARAGVFEAFADGDAAVRRDGAATNLQQQRIRSVTTYATKVAADAARFAYSWAGSHGLRPSVIRRCFRDIHAGTQHIYVDNGTVTGYAQTLLAES
jgi:indole-3-acetate monooxygenase